MSSSATSTLQNAADYAQILTELLQVAKSEHPQKALEQYLASKVSQKLVDFLISSGLDPSMLDNPWESGADESGLAYARIHADLKGRNEVICLMRLRTVLQHSIAGVDAKLKDLSSGPSKKSAPVKHSPKLPAET